MKLRINAKLRAALIAAIATVGFTLPQAQAEQQQLTLQSTDRISVTGGVGTMTGGNSSLKWEGGSTGAGLSSWKLSLELDPGAGNQDIFNLNASSSASTGYHLHIDGTTSLILRDNSNNELATVALDGRTPITLSFVMNVDEAQTSLGTGTFYLSSGTADPIAASVTQTTGTNNTTFHYGTGSGNGDTRLWTNGGAQKFYTITLTQLDNNVITVPAAVWKGEEGTNTWVASNFTPEYKSGDDVKFTANGSHTVVVDSAVTAGKMTVTGADYTFSINSNASLGVESVSVVAGASAKLDGEGRYVLADGSAAIGGMQLADTWAGVVAISGAAFADNGTRLNTLNGLSKADSWVALKGTSGWSGGTEISANLLLEKGAGDWAFQQNNGNNNTTLSFTGKIKGDGKLGRGNGTGSTYTYAFSGDISGWTGTFQSYSNDNQSTTFRVSGAATSVKANLVNARGTFKVDVQNSATFDGSVDATELTVAGNQTATFNGTTNISNGVTLGSGATLVNGGTLTIGGTVTFGGNAIENNGGTVHFGNNLVFNLDGLTPDEQEDVHTYTLFSGSTTVDLTTLGVGNITLTGGTTGKVWSFSDHGTVSWTLPSDLVWDGAANNKWSYSDANWQGSVFVENAAANFYQDATVEVSGNVVASAIAVGNGEAAANVTVSAGESSTLTASTLQVDNGSLTTNVTIQGLAAINMAEGTTWNIGGTQTINEGTHNGTITVLRGGTVVLANAAESAALLQSITGEGNITLKVDTDLAGTTAQEDQPRTQATGTLTIDHSRLKLGKMETDGAFADHYVDLSSFTGVTLDNGTLWVHTAPLTVKDVKVVNGTSTIHVQDKSSSDTEYLTLAGTTTIDAGSTLKFVGAWKGQTGIELLAGEGTLELAGPGEIGKYHIDGGSIGKIIVSSGVVSATATNITTGALQMTAGTLAVGGTSSLGAINIGPGTLTINSGATVAAASLSIADNKKATLNINGSLDVSGNFYAIGCTNTTDIIGSGEGSSLTVGSLDICNVGTNFNLRNITMTVSGKANAGDGHNKNTTHIDLNAGSALNLLGEVTFNTNENKYCTLNVNGGALTAGADEEGVVTRVFQNIAAGTSGGTVDFLNGDNTVANLDMTAGNLDVTVGEHASLTLAAGTLKSAIANEGVLTLNGAIGLDNIGEEWVTTNPYGYEGSVDTEHNGFVASALTAVTFATGDGEVILGEGVEAAMTYKGYHGTVNGGVFSVLQDAPDHTTYHLNSATEESLATAISVGGTDLNLVIMNAGTNLSATGVEATVDTLRINTTEGDAATLTAGTASFTHLIGEGEVDVAAATTLTAANITVAQGKELTIGGEGALHGLTAINGAGTTHVDAAGVAGGALAISGGGTTTFGAGETISLEGLNISGDGTTVTFDSLVTVTGAARPSVGYENPNTSGATVTFNAGFEYNGTNGYGLLLGNGNTVYLGGTTDLSDKNVGISATGKIVLNEGADVKFGRVINTSSNNNNNGIVEVADGAVLATVVNDANYITTLTNAGEVTFGGSATIVTLNNSRELAFGKSASVANLDNSGALTASGNITVTDSYANTGSITVVGSKLSVNNSAESLDLGRIVLDNGELNINYGGEGRVRDIKSLAIAGNSKLTQTSWNNFMHIGAINDVDVSQPGSFTWEMKTNHWSNSVLYLTGAGAFSGTFTAKRTAHSGDNGAYQGYVQIDNEEALQNAVLNVVGYQNNADVDYMSVALHTATVETAGLSGNAQAIVFAGEADNTTGSGDNKRGQIAPSSVDTSTLVLDVAKDADLTYSGAVLEGISLQKDGAGAQTFNGDMSHFNGSVTVNDGTLTLGGDNTYTYSGPTVVNGGKLVVEGVLANSEITVGQNGTVENKGSGALTLSDVDVQLTRIENISGTEMTMKNADGVLSLEELTIGAGSTVSFYDKAATPAEGTITVTETLEAGGGTLLANLVMEDGATLDVDGGNAMALTLGSEFNLAEGAIVTLDNDTLAAIAGLENIGDTVILVKRYQVHALITNLVDGDWSRTHFDLSSITDADYKLFVTDSQIGLVKSSNVPEPTTGTLSLLALAALAARRRRKH